MPQLHSIESKGLAAELVGLVLLLVATLWQVSVTDWMDGFPAKSQYYIQETANLAILLAQSKTADAMREGKPEPQAESARKTAGAPSRSRHARGCDPRVRRLPPGVERR